MGVNVDRAITAIESPSTAGLESAVVASRPASALPETAQLLRGTIEFLIVLLLGILLARTFMAEAYVVPTGSMAPTLLGLHQSFDCQNCKQRFELGQDELGQIGRPVCPNCGWDASLETPLSGYGDRLLVQKFLFDLRPPRRWESAVFQNPADPTQAYVKRVVGLPGEAIQIRDGEVYVNGSIARKSPAEQRNVRVLVYDQAHPPADQDRFPRWRFMARRDLPSGWLANDDRFLRPPLVSSVRPGETDWLCYRHWQPEKGHYGPILDYLGYNGGDYPGHNKVPDIMVEAVLQAGPGIESVRVRLSHRSDNFVVTIPVDGKGTLALERNGRPVEIIERPEARVHPDASGVARLELFASAVDQRISVEINDQLLFEPYDFQNRVVRGTSFDSPLALGVVGAGTAAVERLRIWRDVYYTSSLTEAPVRPHGVDMPYPLGPDEYFVLGDNSAVSNDSRFWPEGPGVPRKLMLGKPFLVHLPSQAVRLQVFGRELYWIPDPREIRYIQ